MLVATPLLAQPAKLGSDATRSLDSELAAQDQLFQTWMDEAHVPGLVWGVVRDGKLIHVKAMGVQDIDARRLVTPDTRFRIASMTKAFTAYAILKLRAEGRLRLDDPVARYVPEAGQWAKTITVADLLHHSGGFVTDDPWGDRQQVMPEAEFTTLLKSDVPQTSAPRTRYEYSNFGYATLGRIISNSSKTDFASYIRRNILDPLAMRSSTFEVRDVADAQLARGYRWENGRWAEEPMMRHGAFGAMGGLVTTANDYSRWIAHLLAGWPARPGAKDDQPMLRDMARGEGFLHNRRRPGLDADACRLSAIYAHGLVQASDCTLGPVLFHGGGFPGYGSHMLLIPEAGVGIFAFANKTYAGPSPPVWDSATALWKAGLIGTRPTAISASLATGYKVARRIWSTGRIDAEAEHLAMNMVMDRSAVNWASTLSALRERAGDCDTSADIVPTGALSGQFSWVCKNGVLQGNLLLAPTQSVQIQSLTLELK